jgi:hypothetical protein
MTRAFARILLLAALFTICVDSIANAQPRATVVGRFRIRNPNGKYYTGPKALVFVEGFNNEHTCRIKKKDSGYFEMKLPRGFSYLKKIHYYDQVDYFKKLPERYVELKLDLADHIYYIGDIVVTWDIEVTDENQQSNYFAGGLIGYLIANAIDDAKPSEAKPVTVSIEPATIARFAQRYETDTANIITALIHAKAK